MKDKLFGRFLLKRPGFTLDAELHVPSRGITGLFGDSGCGKTTLLRCLAGLERADDGLLLVNGRTWQDESKGIFLKPYERPIGMVFQEARLFSHINIEGNLLYGVKRKRGLKGRPEEFEHILDLLGIEPLLERKPDRLSGGELQRVAIGRALLTKPELLLMDEPLAALDNRRKREIMPYLDRLHEELEIPIVYVSHSPEEMIRLADRLVHLEKGRTIGTGEVVEMLANSLIDQQAGMGENLFDGIVEIKDPEHNVIVLSSPVGKLYFPDPGAECGDRLRLRVSSHDILLSREQPAGIGMLNVLKGTVSELNSLETGDMQVILVVEGYPLTLTVNSQCFRQAPVEIGQRVCASFNKAFVRQHY